MKKKTIALAVLSALCFGCSASFALTVGTFDIENFHIAGTGGKSKTAAYEQRDMLSLARSVKKSRAAALALQEVEGDATMRYFTVTALRGWKYAGNDTAGANDLYFLWDPALVELKSRVTVLQTQALTRWPIAARFKDLETGHEYTLVNAHLENKAASEQMRELHRIAKGLPMPVILLGNFGDPKVGHPDVDFRRLENGFSCDNLDSSPDFVGVLGLAPEKIGEVKETETRIPSRSNRRREHPSHDIITVDIFD